ncbi:MAG: hypothetical protein ACUX7D_07960 [Candidatus Methanodesulfokora washburnensis]
MPKSTSSELPDKKFFETIMRRVRGIPFSYVIKMTTGHEVYPVKDEDTEVINEIFEKAKAVIKEAKNEDFSSLRPNEISNKLEDMLREKLGGSIPENKVAGYPNILIERKRKPYYIEVKLADVKEMNSSFRTFYYEPVELAKVTKDACHIIVGFIHRMRSIIGFKIIDASRIRVNLKSEFNTNNKELYRQENILKEYFEQGYLDIS